MKTRKRDIEATCAAILDGAEKCFIEKGFEGASMSAIATSANVTQSLIHYHYKNKENLWNEVKRRRLSESFTKQKELLGQPVDEELFTNIIHIYFSTMRESPGISRLMGWKTLSTTEDSNLSEENAEQEATTVAIQQIQEAQKKGILRKDINPSHIMVSIFALVNHWFNAKEDYFSRSDLDISTENADEDYLHFITDMMMKGIFNTQN